MQVKSMGGVITPGGAGATKSLVDTIDRENVWRSDIRDLVEQYGQATHLLSQYAQHRHSNHGLTYAHVEFPAETPRIIMSGYDIAFQLYILDHLFQAFFDKAVVTPYKIGNSEAIARVQEDPLSMDRLFGIANLASRGNPQLLRRYDFFKSSFTVEELQTINERLEETYRSFSFAAHPNNTDHPEECILSGLDSLAVIGVKILRGEFRDFRLMEGTVSRRYYDERTYEGNLMPPGIVIDGQLVSPTNVNIGRIGAGDKIKYIRPHQRDPMIFEERAYDGIILEISKPQ